MRQIEEAWGEKRNLTTQIITFATLGSQFINLYATLGEKKAEKGAVRAHLIERKRERKSKIQLIYM